ncbi:MAG: ribonuclease P protein component [Chthoniobacterales bacterium]|nr:ribonuclease P protein component [Chthoniobacterales bacterium]
MKKERRYRRSRKIRLTSSIAFREVRARGRSKSGKLFRLSVCEGLETEPTAVGFVVPKKLGSAPERNRLRRRLREIHRLSQHKILGGKWVVVLAYPEAVRATYWELEKEWLRLGKCLGIFAL